MRIVVNGTEQDAPRPGASVADLLARLGVDAATVVVERNREIVDRDRYGQERLAEGDRIEIVRFVGGG